MAKCRKPLKSRRFRRFLVYLNRHFGAKNYLSELSIEEFAHYSGRSLSSFKREFAELSGGYTPARWIMRKRLDDAMVMLKKGISASEVYVQVGFKNLSHFSTAFKKHFGIAPTRIMNTI
ncbi:helix-turn-helix transcriptional regulator [uncultured Muribaculum sp.]|uniref:helix-turn-helix transcriptional regulator n=1 Tax=uncultured Muribaculum sp. TaxID=1918613 RepID=UPI0025EE5DEC|nr:AraC family transcriptional regulator [uncultured Muribaculum sp.]